MTAHMPWNSVHLIADLDVAAGLDDPARIAVLLRDAAEAAQATVLDVKVHHFGECQGVTGVALLAESHISIHTWPECNFAAIDIFMCGERNDAQAALDLICSRLDARVRSQQRIVRGAERVPADDGA